jgi:exosortase A
VEARTYPPADLIASTNWLHVTFLLAFVAIGVAYAGTYVEMAGIWFGSDTYIHGVLIGPIALWLVWRLRDRLREISTQPFPAGLLAVLLTSVLWATGRLMDANFLEHLGAVAIIPAVVLSIYGLQVVRALAFPLGYLLFAVPMGEALIPVLMEFTADFTVAAVQLSGVAVFRDGLRFSTAEGDFAVEKACSGIRYLTACLAVGTLFAYFFFRTWSRALTFIALAVIVPIVANGIRAWLIVVIAHASGMRLAVGVDHFVYGWLLFGVVIAILFKIGLVMQRGEPPATTERPAPIPPAPQSRTLRTLLPLATTAVVLAAPVILAIRAGGGGDGL